MPTDRVFVPALELSRHLYVDVVRPLLAANLPGLPYAAGLVGSGSDVLGYDTERSTDHDWGVRLMIFLDADVPVSTHQQIDALVRQHLPDTILGVPTKFVESPLEAGTPVLATTAAGESFTHGVKTGTLEDFLEHRFGVRRVDEFDVPAWLTVAEQHLLEVVRGGIWRDDTGELTRTRIALDWYPDDVWRYRLAAAWKRVAQHEAFIGRAGEVVSDLGSHVITLALVQDLVYLAFLVERHYAPYEKWTGHAFSHLRLAPVLSPILERARFGSTWQDREAAVIEAGTVLGAATNALGLCTAVDPTPRPYFNRPFQVLFADRFVDALLAAVTDPVVEAMPGPLGGTDQYINTTDGREWIDLHLAIRTWLRSLTP